MIFMCEGMLYLQLAVNTFRAYESYPGLNNQHEEYQWYVRFLKSFSWLWQVLCERFPYTNLSRSICDNWLDLSEEPIGLTLFPKSILGPPC